MTPLRATPDNTIELPAIDEALAVHHAARRQASKVGVVDRKAKAGGDPIALNLIGARGELAFARFMGLEDIHTHDDKIGDQGADLNLGGLRIEVKTRQYSGDDLLLMVPFRDGRQRKTLPPDVMVLVQALDRRHVFKGWITWQRFAAVGWPRCRGRGHCDRRPREPHRVMPADWCTRPDRVLEWRDLNAPTLFRQWLEDGRYLRSPAILPTRR